MREVTSTFNIFEHGRTTHNNRPYLLSAVKRVIESPKTQEALKLGELYGYYGHGKRQYADKLNPSEIEVVTIKGKQVVIEQVPSNVTISLAVDDKGNVTHTERILDTPTGLIVDAMESSGVGGWSWAASGQANNFKGFGGFDYVKRPSYIDNDKRTKLMLESLGVDSPDEAIRMNLESAGLSSEESNLILESWEGKPLASDEHNSLKFQCLMLESIIEDKDTHHNEVVAELKQQINDANGWKEQRSKLMLESLDALPIIPSDEQRTAFINLSGKDDLEIVAKMFESVQANLMTLPTHSDSPLVVSKKGVKQSDNELSGQRFIDLSGHQPNPFAR